MSPDVHDIAFLPAHRTEGDGVEMQVARQPGDLRQIEQIDQLVVQVEVPACHNVDDYQPDAALQGGSTFRREVAASFGPVLVARADQFHDRDQANIVLLVDDLHFQ